MWEQKKVYDPMSSPSHSHQPNTYVPQSYATSMPQAGIGFHSMPQPSGPPPPYTPPYSQPYVQPYSQPYYQPTTIGHDKPVMSYATAPPNITQSYAQQFMPNTSYPNTNYPSSSYGPQYQYNPYPQIPPNSTLVMPQGFDSGARFDGIAKPNIPPPPPGVVPNPAQLAMMQSSGNVVVGQKKNSWLSGGSGAGYTFW